MKKLLARISIVAAFLGYAPLLVAVESDILSSGTPEEQEIVSPKPAYSWQFSPSGQSLFLMDHDYSLLHPSLSVQHTSFPSSSTQASSTFSDHRVGLNYRSNLGDMGFLESRSLVDESNFGPHSSGYRQVLGYGLRLLDRETISFEVVPGVMGDYSTTGPIEERLRLMGNLNQNLSWAVTDRFVVTQNFNTALERTEEDTLSAVMNLDLETLFADRLSFKLSYEVHYDDSTGDEMEQRDSRLSTSVGFRF